MAISSFRVQRPFLADFVDLSVASGPSVHQLPRSLPRINRAIGVGTPILPRTVPFNRDLRDLSREIFRRFDDPTTLLALRDLNTTLTVTRPAVEYIAPFQTVCNYANYFLTGLGEHMSLISPDNTGTVQNQGAKTVNVFQPTATRRSTPRNVDIPPGQNAHNADVRGPGGHRLQAPLMPYPAIDAQGNADCQRGQDGYPAGPLHHGRTLRLPAFSPTAHPRPATARSPTPTTRSCPAARSSPGSSGSTTWRTFPDGALRRARGRRASPTSRRA